MKKRRNQYSMSVGWTITHILFYVIFGMFDKSANAFRRKK